MAPGEEEDQIEVLDVDQYQGEKNEDFSHQALVMTAMRKVIEYGCQELVPGYYNTETDQHGKVKIVYKQDTRKAFIESVRTLRMVMICDFDTDAKKMLMETPGKDKDDQEIKLGDNNLMKKLKTKKKFHIDEQEKWWCALSDGQRKQLTAQGNGCIEGYFNMNLPWFQNYFLEELEIYREIFEELTLLTERLKFYKKQRKEG